jgi:hypothetical protein
MIYDHKIIATEPDGTECEQLDYLIASRSQGSRRSSSSGSTRSSVGDTTIVAIEESSVDGKCKMDDLLKASFEEMKILSFELILPGPFVKRR